MGRPRRRRIETLRNYFANGQMTEQHAEFISSEHSATLGMAQRFGLTLENTYADPKGMRDTYWFKGARYGQKALNRDWQDFGWKLFRDAVREAPGARFDRSHIRRTNGTKCRCPNRSRNTFPAD